MNTRVLLVDDDPALRRLLGLRLDSAGYQVCTADGAAAALAAVEQSLPDVVVTDLRMDGMDGIALQECLAARWPGLPVILITAHGTIPDAVAATQLGAFGFLTKPIDTPEFLETVRRAAEVTARVPAGGRWREGVLGDSPAMSRLLDRARRVAGSRANVLITGPSGSGKDVLARAIHEASGRRGPFVPVNCTAIPAPLLESELFGHRKGAFTGATSSNEGLLCHSHGGTLLLDEIGDMPLDLQAKLLRVLEDRQVRAVGARESMEVDLRIIAATNRDLDEARSEGGFRDDLYYRLRVVHLEIPPLAERRGDIRLLVQHKLSRIAADEGTTPRHFSPAAMDRLAAATWPGNVRQLFNVVEHCVAFSPSRVVGARLVDEALAEWTTDGKGGERFTVQPLEQARDGFMRTYLLELMEATRGNVTLAARLAQRNRTDLYKLLNRHHIDWSRFKSP